MDKLTWTTEKRRLGDLVKWEQNPRQLNKAQAERLRHSIQEFGYSQLYEVEPENNCIIDGHQRDEIMLRMAEYGADAEIECRVASRALTLEERKEYIVLKHKGSLGDWDWDAMHNLYDFSELTDWGFDADELLAHGFEDEVLPEDPGPQIDKASELQGKWSTSPGQLWQLGEHKIICGDCTDRAIVERVMGGERADMVFTDPPYGVDYAGKNVFLNAIGRPNSVEKDIEGDHQKPEDMSAFWTSAFSCIREFMKPGASYYITGPQGGDLLLLLLAIRESGFPLRHMLVWAKNQFVIGRSDYHYKHEPIIYGWVKGTHKFYGGHGESSLWEIDKPRDSNYHPTEKPVELYERGILNSTIPGDIVIDPFLGSAPAVIACERLGRRCRGIEISEAYTAVCLQRWSDMTGKEPVLVE